MNLPPLHYKLDADGTPVPVADVIEWALWFETADRLVLRDGDERTGWEVSTVFLGLDHQHGNGPPLLYETLVFKGPLDGEMRRYTTRSEAEAGHREVCAKLAELVALHAPRFDSDDSG
jgi:hypothetical protein